MSITKTLTLLLLGTLYLQACQLKPLDAAKVHEQAITIDTHCDTPMRFLRQSFDIGKTHEAPGSRVDLPRMKEGGLDAMFFAIFTSQRQRTDENYALAYQMAHQMLDSTERALTLNDDIASLALRADDVLAIEKEGKRAIYLGMENGFPLNKDIKRVEEFYNRGIRYVTLAHTKNNDICDSSTDKEGPEHNGLSNYGEEVLKEMNRLGILVDVSHISDKAFYDVLDKSTAPIFASHSSVRSLCNHPRNMDDDMIKALARKGGVIQICILGAYIQEEDTTSLNYVKKEELRLKYNNWTYASDEERKKAWGEWREINTKYPPVLPSIADAVNHIDYVVNLVGIDYVGIGSDFDGGGGLSDCVDVADFPKITEELIKRGYTQKDINKIWGGNFLRVFKAVEEAAEKTI
ncbi:dipeptidase [Carboxylicivirga sp. M1479]|uniref:dipeptidase n=1 Tax=Carboxylicivirga sp. M1479 TaxID=2594476 RepID=UPI001178C495|nr:dipeptidase [Carboxylicivirga sp. M1479]TRX72447.1 membrane dipeptidase [Carboxylicivirga sp. M1479]